MIGPDYATNGFWLAANRSAPSAFAPGQVCLRRSCLGDVQQATYACKLRRSRLSAGPDYRRRSLSARLKPNLHCQCDQNRTSQNCSGENANDSMACASNGQRAHAFDHRPAKIHHITSANRSSCALWQCGLHQMRSLVIMVLLRPFVVQPFQSARRLQL